MNSASLHQQFDRIFIDPRSLDSVLARRVQSLFPLSMIEVASESSLPQTRGPLSAAQFNQSKRLLHIKPFEGHFFKRCPGASQKKILTCCNYHVLNLGQQCNMNCSYCYLQSYLNTPRMLMYSNIEQALQELEEMAIAHPDLPYRVGTGEVIDSLSLDEISLYSRQLIEFFRRFPRWTLEFKTKSDKVDQFLDCEHAGNVVVSWSINAPQVIQREEHGTASFEQRLLAARKCADRGFPVAFHIDPLIHYAHWREGYEQLIEGIHQRFQTSEVHVISVGALRFQPEQRHLMRERFGMNSWVTSAEMFSSEGGKLRYDQALRQEMFDFVIQGFKKRNPAWRLFLCMETPESWISAYEKTPRQVPELRDIFRPLPKIHFERAGVTLE